MQAAPAHPAENPENPEKPRLYVFSGAGLSAQSGLATFRSAGGIWSTSNRDKVCNMATWKDNRSAVFDFYRARRAECASAHPNTAHETLARWQRHWGTGRVRLLTQNVDDLLERAGCLAVTHLHGRLDALHCTACDTRFAVDDEAFGEHTRCLKCNSLKGVKPAVVFFGQRAPAYIELGRMSRAIRDHDIFVAVGTAFEVIAPDAMLPSWRMAHPRNWQVNPQPQASEWFGHSLTLPASEGLVQLQSQLTEIMGGPVIG